MDHVIDGWSSEKVQPLQQQVASALGKTVVFQDPPFTVNATGGFLGFSSRAKTIQCPEMIVIPPGKLEAARWFLKAANQGNARSQSFLGSMYLYGWGVSEDYVMAYKWANLAALSGDADAADLRDRIASRMTSSQIARAQQLSRDQQISSNKVAFDDDVVINAEAF